MFGWPSFVGYVTFRRVRAYAARTSEVPPPPVRERGDRGDERDLQVEVPAARVGRPQRAVHVEDDGGEETGESGEGVQLVHLFRLAPRPDWDRRRHRAGRYAGDPFPQLLIEHDEGREENGGEGSTRHVGSAVTVPLNTPNVFKGYTR